MWILLSLYCAVNLTAFTMMGVDKRRARLHRRRISERALFSWAIGFGGLGGTVGMQVFRHKTKHTRFVVCFPLLAAVQLTLLIALLSVL